MSATIDTAASSTDERFHSLSQAHIDATNNEPQTMPVKFHIGINVADLNRSVEFYRVLIGQTPAKYHDDYAKFELSDPPLVLSLIPSPQLPGGSLNHLGLRVPSPAALVEIQHRLELAGITTQREEGVECCYARQTKFWVTDPDRNLWEIYTFEGDIDHHGMSPTASQTRDDNGVSAPKVIWQHRLFDSFPARIPAEDESIDEVQLEGTFNANSDFAQRRNLLSEALRVLCPGGRVAVHGLVSDRPFPQETPDLPGLAAMVQRVPVETECPDELRAVGFESVIFEKLNPIHCFQVPGVELRELRLLAFKPIVSLPSAAQTTVVYRGPHAEVVDDHGTTYPRGVRVRVRSENVEHLKRLSPANQFVFLVD